MPTRPPPPPVPPPDPALVCLASSNFFCGSSLSSTFSFQYPASVFRGSTVGCFLGDGAGFGGGGGSGWEGGKGPAGACAKRRPGGSRPMPQRIAIQAVDLNLSKLILYESPKKMTDCGTTPIDVKSFGLSCFLMGHQKYTLRTRSSLWKRY